MLVVATTSFATNVRFSFIDQFGNPASRVMTLVPDPNANPSQSGTNMMFVAAVVTNVPGTLVVPLLPIVWDMTIQGSLTKLFLYVYDTNVVVNATDLTTNLFTGTNTSPQFIFLVDSRQVTLSNPSNSFQGGITLATNALSANFAFFVGDISTNKVNAANLTNSLWIAQLNGLGTNATFYGQWKILGGSTDAGFGSYITNRADPNPNGNDNLILALGTDGSHGSNAFSMSTVGNTNFGNLTLASGGKLIGDISQATGLTWQIINSLFPSSVLTNNESQPTTLSNNVTMYGATTYPFIGYSGAASTGNVFQVIYFGNSATNSTPFAWNYQNTSNTDNSIDTVFRRGFNVKPSSGVVNLSKPGLAEQMEYHYLSGGEPVCEWHGIFTPTNGVEQRWQSHVFDETNGNVHLTYSFDSMNFTQATNSNNSGLLFTANRGANPHVIEDFQNGSFINWDYPNGTLAQASDSVGGSHVLLTFDGVNQRLGLGNGDIDAVNLIPQNWVNIYAAVQFINNNGIGHAGVGVLCPKFFLAFGGGLSTGTATDPGSGNIVATNNVTVGALNTIGVVTNDATGQLHTTPTLPVSMLSGLFYNGKTNIGSLTTALLITLGHTMPNTNYTPSVSFMGSALAAAITPSYSLLTPTNFTLNLSAGISGGDNLTWSVIYSP